MEPDAGAGTWQTAGRAAYESLYALTLANLAVVNVIVDAPSYYPEVPARLREIAAACGTPHMFVECVCADVDLVDRRMRSRHRLRSQMPSLDGTPDDAPPYVDRHGNLERVHDRVTFRPDDGIIVVDTTELPLNVNAIFDRITVLVGDLQA